MTSDLGNVYVSRFLLSPHQQVCNVVREKCVSKHTQRGDEIHRGSWGKSGYNVQLCLESTFDVFYEIDRLGSADCPIKYLIGGLNKIGNGA